MSRATRPSVTLHYPHPSHVDGPMIFEVHLQGAVYKGAPPPYTLSSLSFQSAMAEPTPTSDDKTASLSDRNPTLQDPSDSTNGEGGCVILLLPPFQALLPPFQASSIQRVRHMAYKHLSSARVADNHLSSAQPMSCVDDCGGPRALLPGYTGTGTTTHTNCSC